MAIPVGPLVDAVLARSRDAGGVGTTRAEVRHVLDTSVLTVNTLQPGWTVSVDCTVPKRTALVPVALFATGADAETAPTSLRICRVVHEGRDLIECPWRQLGRANRRWLRTSGPRPTSFARIGPEWLAIAPASDGPITLTVVYAGRPPEIGADIDPTYVRDDRQAAVLALAETLILMRQQDLEHVLPAVERLKAAVQLLPMARGV